MVSLYKRATPSQVRVMKIVSGAVKNAADAHPELDIPQHFRRSVAKRAAGTLTASWPEVLAARSALSGTGDVTPLGLARSRTVTGYDAVRRGAVTPVYRRSPLIGLWREISAQLWAVKKSGNIERERAFIDVLKMIAAKQKAMT